MFDAKLENKYHHGIGLKEGTYLHRTSPLHPYLLQAIVLLHGPGNDAWKHRSSNAFIQIGLEERPVSKLFLRQSKSFLVFCKEGIFNKYIFLLTWT